MEEGDDGAPVTDLVRAEFGLGGIGAVGDAVGHRPVHRFGVGGPGGHIGEAAGLGVLLAQGLPDVAYRVRPGAERLAVKAIVNHALLPGPLHRLVHVGGLGLAAAPVRAVEEGEDLGVGAGLGGGELPLFRTVGDVLEHRPVHSPGVPLPGGHIGEGRAAGDQEAELLRLPGDPLFPIVVNVRRGNLHQGIRPKILVQAFRAGGQGGVAVLSKEAETATLLRLRRGRIATRADKLLLAKGILFSRGHQGIIRGAVGRIGLPPKNPLLINAVAVRIRPGFELQTQPSPLLRVKIVQRNLRSQRKGRGGKRPNRRLLVQRVDLVGMDIILVGFFQGFLRELPDPVLLRFFQDGVTVRQVEGDRQPRRIGLLRRGRGDRQSRAQGQGQEKCRKPFVHAVFSFM